MALENLTYGMLALWGGILLTILAQAVIKKGDSRKTWTFVGIGLLVLGGLPYLGMNIPFLDNQINLGGGGTTTTTTTGTGLALIDACGVEDTTVTLAGTDAFTGVAVGKGHGYRINGGPRLSVSDSGTFTASPGDSLDILWGNETGDFNYINDLTSFTLKSGRECVGTQVITKELYSNGTLSINVFNEEGNIIDKSLGENETLGAGDVVNLKVELRGQYQKGFPHGGYFVFEYNRTGYDDIIFNIDGVSTESTSTPTAHAIESPLDTLKSYKIGPILGQELVTGVLTIDVGANNPSIAVTGADNNDINVTFYPIEFYIDDNNAGQFTGPAVQDEANALTSKAPQTTIVSID